MRAGAFVQQECGQAHGRRAATRRRSGRRSPAGIRRVWDLGHSQKAGNLPADARGQVLQFVEGQFAQCSLSSSRSSAASSRQSGQPATAAGYRRRENPASQDGPGGQSQGQRDATGDLPRTHEHHCSAANACREAYRHRQGKPYQRCELPEGPTIGRISPSSNRLIRR